MCYEDVHSNIATVRGAGGGGGCQISRKKCYVTVEWPLNHTSLASLLLYSSCFAKFGNFNAKSAQLLINQLQHNEKYHRNYEICCSLLQESCR